jgi:hypothetical protein
MVQPISWHSTLRIFRGLWSNVLSFGKFQPCSQKQLGIFLGVFCVNSKNIPQKMAKIVNLLKPKIGNTKKTLLKKFLNHWFSENKNIHFMNIANFLKLF